MFKILLPLSLMAVLLLGGVAPVSAASPSYSPNMGTYSMPQQGYMPQQPSPGALFAAPLSGEADNVQTPATGQATFQVSPSGNSISFELTVKDLVDTESAHIHLAKAGLAGPVVVTLYSGPKKAGPFSGQLASGTITTLEGPLAGKPLSALVDAMRAGETYVNVHTDRYPAGEIRGQIQAQTSKAKSPKPSYAQMGKSQGYAYNYNYGTMMGPGKYGTYSYPSYYPYMRYYRPPFYYYPPRYPVYPRYYKLPYPPRFCPCYRRW